MKLLSRIIFLALLIFGCGNDNDTSTVKACEDYASAIAKASVRCEDNDMERAYQGYIDVALNGSCGNVLAVRDSKALYEECIPYLDTIECTAFIKGNYDAPCVDQLIIPNE